MKKFIVVSTLFFSCTSLIAVTFEFSNQRNDKANVDVKIILEEDGSEQTMVLSPGTSTLTLNRKKADIKKLILESFVKDETKIIDGQPKITSTVHRDVIYFKKANLTKEEKDKYPPQTDEKEDWGTIHLMTKVYAQPRLEGKKKFRIEKGLGWEGYFQVTAIN